MSPITRLDLAYLELLAQEKHCIRQARSLRRVRRRAEFWLLRVRSAVTAWRVRTILEG